MQEDSHPHHQPTFWHGFWRDLGIATSLFVILSVVGSSSITLGAPEVIVLPIVFAVAVGLPSVLYWRYHTAVASRVGVKPTPQFPGPDLVLWLPGIAAILFVVVGVMRPAWNPASRQYSSGTDETKNIELADGSVATLKPQSRIRWIGSRQDRRVVVEEGEIIFQVAHDITHPFRVTAGNGEIRDLATKFDVRRKRNGSVVVTVLSGRVAVKELTSGGAQPAWSERLLEPNEQVEYNTDALIADVHTVSASGAIRRYKGLIEPEVRSFADFVGELNRYSAKPIFIGDPRLEAMKVYMVGSAPGVRDIPATLRGIQELWSIVVTDTGDAYVLTYKNDVSPTERFRAMARTK